MRTTILMVLSTVALVLVTIGPTAALQEASQQSPGYLINGRVTSTADIGPGRRQDRGFGVGLLAGGVKNQHPPEGIGSCKGDFDLNCYRRFDCHESADDAYTANYGSVGLEEFDNQDARSFEEAVRAVYDRGRREWEAAKLLCDLTYPDNSGVGDRVKSPG